jgi:hypothetical protein
MDPIVSDLAEAATQSYSPVGATLEAAQQAALSAIDSWDQRSGINLYEWIYLSVTASFSNTSHYCMPVLSQAKH